MDTAEHNLETRAAQVDSAAFAGPAERSWASVPVHVWLQIGVLAFLYVSLHWDQIDLMRRIALNNPDWSHALLIPLLSVYFVHTRRQRILNTPVRHCWWGLPVLIGAVLLHFLGIFPVQSLMVRGYAMILELLGLVLFLLGPRMLSIVWFPICYLGFAVKFSTKIWNFIAWKLQMFAAKSSVDIMNVLGLDAEVHGSRIELWDGVTFLGALNVAEACSGLRMLVAFIALGTAVVYVVERPWWSRAILLGMTVPIAVLVNAMRVTVIGFLHLVNTELSAGDFHLFVGMLMVIPAMGLFLLLGWILDNLVVHEEEDDEEDADGDTAHADA